MEHLSDLRNIVNEPVKEFVANVKAGEHGCIFFISKEVMKDIQFVFVKSGLENNWGVVYTTATESIEQVRYSMKNYGIDTAKFEDNGSLIIIIGEDLYKNPENPDLENWKSVAKSISQKFIANGK
ncbi:MAG TPA: MEDS domain-containing protein, partial [Candidatus Nitrosocosmicus sp.]